MHRFLGTTGQHRTTIFAYKNATQAPISPAISINNTNQATCSYALPWPNRRRERDCRPSPAISLPSETPCRLAYGGVGGEEVLLNPTVGL